jgi:hypothetical protein
MRLPCWPLVVAFLIVASVAQAQDAGRVGLTVAYPEAVGIVWHVTDRVAVRPEFGFKNGSNESLSVSTVVVGVSGLFYVRKWDALSAYVSPRVGLERDSATNQDGSSPAPPTTTYVFDGSFGFQYSFQKQCAFFGETGVAYTRSSTTFDERTASLHTTGTRAGDGHILYF